MCACVLSIVELNAVGRRGVAGRQSRGIAHHGSKTRQQAAAPPPCQMQHVTCTHVFDREHECLWSDEELSSNTGAYGGRIIMREAGGEGGSAIATICFRWRNYLLPVEKAEETRPPPTTLAVEAALDV
jgi:hypothetical protein